MKIMYVKNCILRNGANFLNQTVTPSWLPPDCSSYLQDAWPSTLRCLHLLAYSQHRRHSIRKQLICCDQYTLSPVEALRRADHPPKESYRLSLIKKLRKLSPMLQKREQALRWGSNEEEKNNKRARNFMRSLVSSPFSTTHLSNILLSVVFQFFSILKFSHEISRSWSMWFMSPSSQPYAHPNITSYVSLSSYVNS
jgi:hypothetical protein